MPPSIRIKIAADPTQTIRASVHDIQLTLVVTIGLVVLVIFLFLRNVWATIIPSIAVPSAPRRHLRVMYLLGFSLDNFSLMALTWPPASSSTTPSWSSRTSRATWRWASAPSRPRSRARREVGFTVLSMSVSLVAVFLPILLMGGIVGRLFREFAATLSIAIAVSLFVSLTATPMMCARFLRHDDEKPRGGCNRACERAFDRMLAHLRTRPPVGARASARRSSSLTLATLVLSVYLFVDRAEGFLSPAGHGAPRGTDPGRPGHLLRRPWP